MICFRAPSSVPKRLLKKQRLTVEEQLVSQWLASIAGIPAGYIDKITNLIYGTSKTTNSSKLNFMPKGGIRMAETTKENGYETDPAVHEIFTKYVTTVNDGIFRAYTSEHSSCSPRSHSYWSSRCLSWTYHRGLCPFSLVRCWLLDGWKVDDTRMLWQKIDETIRLREVTHAIPSTCWSCW